MLNEVRRKPEKPRIRQVKTLRPAILGGKKYDLSWECSGAGVMTLAHSRAEAFRLWKETQPRPIGHN